MKEQNIIAMDESFISNCQQGDNAWKCPVNDCGKMLSRKQTLKCHIVNQHDLQAGNPSKRYKQYDFHGSTSAIPRTTLWRLKSRTHDVQTTNQSAEVAVSMDDLNEAADESLISSDDETLNMEFLISESDESSTDEESLAVERESTNLQNDEPPIYVLPPSDTIYQSSITKCEHSLAVSAFATRHNLSDVAVNDMLQLIQLHLPDNNIAETNTRKLKESCGFNSSYLKHHLYCDVCKKLYDTEEEQCITPGCQGMKSNSKCTNYFVSGKTDVQLKEILQREGVWQSIEESRPCMTEHISDVRSGAEYRKLQEPGGFLHNSQNITLSLFIDGIPLFKSSSTSLWPVYFLINEIPPRERFSKKNMVLWGIWQGVGKPKMNMFLRPLITDLVDLYENGISFTYSQEKPEITVRAMLIIATMDLQARSYFLSMTMHNGEYGCLYCMEPGKVVQSGKGHCRAYLTKDQIPAARSDETLRQNALDARRTGKKVQGVLGQSVLWYLPYFSFTKNVVIDYMHGTLLGITKKMLELWFDKTHASEPFNICDKMIDIDKDLGKIKPLYIVHRLPRVLTNTYNNWKASELRNWLLFYSLPCLKGQLPDLYLTHFSCLAESIYILLKEGITNEDLQRADMLLRTYVKNVQQLYGDRFMSMNVHNLNHITNFVKQWGPIWAWSCFCFESFNGEIKRTIHGTGNVCKQIFWTLQAQKRVEAKARQLPKESKVKEFMENVLERKSERFSENSKAYKCSVIKVSDMHEEFNEALQPQLIEQTGTASQEDFVSVSKIARNGFLMYSKVCTKVKKQNSYTIHLEKKLPRNGDVTAVEVHRYIMEKQSRKVFAVGRLIVSCGSVLPRRVNHLQKTDYIGEEYNTVVPAEYLGEPLMVINTRKGVFVALLPNHIERD